MRQATDSRLLVLLLALLAAAGMLLAPLDESRGSDRIDPFVIDGLVVTVEAQDAVQAKDEALNKAMREGLERVLRRSTSAADRAKLPARNEALAQRLLDRLSIRAERVGPTSYGATFRVAFSPLAVRGFLARHGARIVEQAAPPILLIPIHVDDGIPGWWDAAGEWARELAEIRFEDGLTPVRLPANSDADQLEPIERILSADQVTLGNFRVRYDTQGVVAVIAATIKGRDWVRLSIVGEDAAGPVDLSEEVQSGDLPAAAQRVAELLSERWKAAVAGMPTEQPTVTSSLPVRVLLHDGEREWLDLQRRLEASGEVQGLSVEAIGSTTANIVIWHSRAPSDLVELFARQGLDLFEAGGTWLLQSY